MQQVHTRNARRGTSSTSQASSLPQFDLPIAEVVDPDRTMERLPALSDVSTDDVAAAAVPAASEALDAAATLEIAPEVSANDILEEEAEAAPVVALPLRSVPGVVPVDLDRLLARARQETSRSPAFFRSASLTPVPVTISNEPTPVPMMLPVEPADALVAPVAARPRLRITSVWITAAAATFLIAAAAIGQARGPSAEAESPVAAAPPVVQVAAAAPVAAAPAAKPAVQPLQVHADAPVVAVQSLPRVEVGTISVAAVAASHRLFVDGRLAPTGTASVSCGQHTVQVGSRGVRRRIDVPCGQEVVVAN